MVAASGALSGRKAEAARNDRMILDAARTVFTRDPGAPVAAVAEEAGVGVGALYRRYASKDELLRTLCTDGLNQFTAIAETVLAAVPDPWEAFACFMGGIIDSDVHSLTVHLAGTFTPTTELRELAVRASTLGERIFTAAQAAGALRGDLVPGDLAMMFEQITAVRGATPERTAALRRRYLALLLDAARTQAVNSPLPGPPPGAGELSRRWRPRKATDAPA
jgi:AcrR family transcriptional regulator